MTTELEVRKKTARYLKACNQNLGNAYANWFLVSTAREIFNRDGGTPLQHQAYESLNFVIHQLNSACVLSLARIFDTNKRSMSLHTLVTHLKAKKNETSLFAAKVKHWDCAKCDERAHKENAEVKAASGSTSGYEMLPIKVYNDCEDLLIEQGRMRRPINKWIKCVDFLSKTSEAKALRGFRHDYIAHTSSAPDSALSYSYLSTLIDNIESVVSAGSKFLVGHDLNIETFREISHENAKVF